MCLVRWIVVSANLKIGLHDCIKMLEWTRYNVASFGGDPENVTAVGEQLAHSQWLHCLDLEGDSFKKLF